MEIINCIEVVVKGMKRELEELQVRFTNYKGVGWENGRFFFPAFVLRIKKIDVAVGRDFAFLSDSGQSRVDGCRRRGHQLTMGEFRANEVENFGKEDGQLEVFRNSQLRKREEFSEIIKSVGEEECLD